MRRKRSWGRLHKLVNGRSQFGVASDGKEPFDLGVIVVDDAHAALTATEGQFRLTLRTGHDAHYPMLDMFENDLQEQSAKTWQDILAGDYTTSQRVPFWSWADKLLHSRTWDRYVIQAVTSVTRRVRECDQAWPGPK